MTTNWKTVVGLFVAIAITGCVADDENDAIKSDGATSASSGSKAPDVTLASLNGQSVSLSSLAGKVVLIDFWGPSCSPCRQSLPFTQRLQDTFGSKGLVVLAVTSEPKSTVQSFLSQNNYTFPTYLDDGQVADKFKVDAIPHTIIIDRSGHVVSEEIGLTPQDETIKQLAAAGLDVNGFEPKNDPMRS